MISAKRPGAVTLFAYHDTVGERRSTNDSLIAISPGHGVPVLFARRRLFGEPIMAPWRTIFGRIDTCNDQRTGLRWQVAHHPDDRPMWPATCPAAPRPLLTWQSSIRQ